MRSDNLDDDDDDIPQNADAVSPIQPLSAVSSYAAGDASAMVSTSGGFGAPGANYSYVPLPLAPCTLNSIANTEMKLCQVSIWGSRSSSSIRCCTVDHLTGTLEE